MSNTTSYYHLDDAVPSFVSAYIFHDKMFIYKVRFYKTF